jgi:2-methylcitrate dehydratase PrpD
MSRIVVEEDKNLTAAYPGRLLTDYHIRLKSGVCIRERTVDPPGHPRNPMSSAEIESKFKRLATATFSADHAERIARCVRRIGTVGVRELVDFLAQAPVHPAVARKKAPRDRLSSPRNQGAGNATSL